MIRATTKLLVRDGCTTGEAATRLNFLGLTPRRAARWDRQNLRRQLRQPYLRGEYVWAKQDAPGYRRYGRHGPPITMRVPAVLDDATFEALQDVLGSSAHGPIKNVRTYPLSERLIGICGNSFGGTYRKDRRGGRREYRCKGARHDGRKQRCADIHRLDADHVEYVVWQAVSALLAEPKRLLEMARDYLALRGEQVQLEGNQLEDIEAKITNLEKSLAIAYAERLNGGLDPAAIKAATNLLNEELGALRRHRDQMKAWQGGRRRRVRGCGGYGNCPTWLTYAWPRWGSKNRRLCSTCWM